MSGDEMRPATQVMHEDIALDAYDFKEQELYGEPGTKVYVDERGDVYTRAGALKAIRYMIEIGNVRPMPDGWDQLPDAG